MLFGKNPDQIAQDLRLAIRETDLTKLQRLLDRHGAGPRDDYGNTLLHWMCNQRDAQAAAVKMVMKALPDAAKLPNYDGSLPLHLAVASHTSAEVVLLLTEDHPKGLQQADNVNCNLPLHEACATKAPMDIVLLLQQAWPAAVQKINGVGHTPLHSACTVTPATFHCDGQPIYAVLWSLLEAWPDAVMQRSHHHETPYDMLKRTGADAQCLQLLRNKRALCQMPERMREMMVSSHSKKFVDNDSSIASTQVSVGSEEEDDAAEVRRRYAEKKALRKEKAKKMKKKKVVKKLANEEVVEI